MLGGNDTDWKRGEIWTTVNQKAKISSKLEGEEDYIKSSSAEKMANRDIILRLFFVFLVFLHWIRRIENYSNNIHII